MLQVAIVHSFLLLNSIPLRGIQQFIHSAVDGHLGCSQLLAIVNKVPINFHVQVFVLAYVFIYLS